MVGLYIYIYIYINEGMMEIRSYPGFEQEEECVCVCIYIYIYIYIYQRGDDGDSQLPWL